MPKDPGSESPTGEIGVSATWSLGLLAALLVPLIAISLYSYPLFHVIVEAISVVVAASLFLVLYHTRRLHDNDYLLFVGIGFLFFVLLDVPHTLGYQGIALFPGFDSDLPTQAYIAQRLMLATTFVIAPLFLKRRVRLGFTFVGFGAVTLLVLVSLLVWRNFPPMFIEGEGLTPLKKTLEIVISAIFLVAIAGLWGNRGQFDPRVRTPLMVALACFVGSELSFTLYNDPFGISNLTGHLFQVSAFYFTYRAVLVTSLENPFGVLFRQLSEREQSLTAANESLNALAEIGDTAISSLKVEELAPALLGRLTSVMGADASALLTYEDGVLRPLATHGFELGDLKVPFGQGFSGRIAADRRPRYVADIQTDAEIQSQPLREQGIRSVLGVPLTVGERFIGTLQVDWRTHHPYDEADVRLLEIVAVRIALAMRNAQLYEGERRIAQVFQEALLALPEHIDGIRYAKAYHSATREAWVGGDFFDLFEVDTRHIGVLIGDVSGKGVEAAVLTSIVKDTIRAHAHQGATPAQVLDMTNDLVERYSDHETFVTVLFGLLERDIGLFTYCNAGHLPAIATRCDGTVRLLHSNSPLLGAFRGMQFVDDQTYLSEGETLVLYTDGLVEARSGSELYGEERLVAAVSRLRNCEPSSVVDILLDDLLRFSGGSLGDDLAMLAVKLVHGE